MPTSWKRPADGQPRDGQRVDVIARDGAQHNGCVYSGSVYLLPPGFALYVVQPTHWRPAAGEEKP